MCLHWAARNGSMPIIKFLLHNTEGAVFTAMEDNYIHKRPIDVAYAVMEKRGDSSSKDTYNQLMNMMKGSNVRTKIQRLKMRTEREQQEKKTKFGKTFLEFKKKPGLHKKQPKWSGFVSDQRRRMSAKKRKTTMFSKLPQRRYCRNCVHGYPRRKAEVKIKSRDMKGMREAAKAAGEKAGPKTSKVAFAKESKQAL